MNWHETIEAIRSDADFKELVYDAYLTPDLVDNTDRFMHSEEFRETLRVLEPHLQAGAKILDVGAGNGVATAAFARAGFSVTALEPDPSQSVGTGAIEELKKELNLPNVEIVRSTSEDVNLPAGSFDVVYVRQALHHADDLEQFVRQLYALLKPEGVMLTVRDHEVNSEEELERFLASHPLHKMYGGEHAFTQRQYEEAFTKAGFDIVRRWTHYESPINFSPKSSAQVLHGIPDGMIVKLRRWIGPLAEQKWIHAFIRSLYDARGVALFDASQVVGRSVAYLLKRPKA